MMISVVIPLYNKEKQIAKSLQSVLSQSYQDFELIVVDDGSTDGSLEAVKNIDDPRIRIIHQENSGVSAARNRGISEATGKYIALLDGDDLWDEEYLSTQVFMISHFPKCQVFSTQYQIRDISGEIVDINLCNILFPETFGELTNYFQVAATSNPPIWTSATVVEKKAIESIGGFPVGVKSGEDLLTWARLACRHRIAYCRKPLATFVFDQQLFNDDQKQRDVDMSDAVGAGLKELLNEYPSTIGLKQYVALWYKMRTRILLSKRHRRLALRESFKSMRYSINAKILAFAIFCFLPYRTVDYLFKRLG